MADVVTYRPNGESFPDDQGHRVDIPADAIGHTCWYSNGMFYVGWLEPVKSEEARRG